MHKKVLIFFPRLLLKNHGGAYTYLYYLKKAIEGKEHRITFLSDIISVDTNEGHGKETIPFIKWIKKILPQKLAKTIQVARYLRSIKHSEIDAAINNIDLNIYDIVHVHETVDLYRFQPLFKNYKGRIILTPHSPKPYHLELLEDVFLYNREQIFGSLYKELEKIDIVGFTLAESLVLPCQSVLEFQVLQWQKLKTLLLQKPIHYIFTGIEKKQEGNFASNIRTEYNIPESAFLICFNGRHNQAKGFDILVKAAMLLLYEYGDIYFIVSGKKDTKPAINHLQWIETGWVNNPEDFIAASNMVVIPNRETFFDLNVLECLSLGKYVLISDTGGNKCFKELQPGEGIMFHEPNVLSLSKALKQCYERRDGLDSKGKNNERLFENFFTLFQFRKNYIELYDKL